MVEKIIITGGPCCGKTTLINHMQGLGLSVVPESAQQIITESFSDDVKDSYDETFSVDKFIDLQWKIARRQIELERGVQDDLVFLDRGLYDAVAYLRLKGVDEKPFVDFYSQNSDYSKKVF